MRSLVTGGAGFIGSNLVNELVKRGDTVTVLDDFSTGKMDNLNGSIDKIKIVKGNVCDLDLMRKLMRENDRVFHLAVQCLLVGNSDPALTVNVNTIGTLNMCIAAHEAHAKLIYISSSEVYGSCKISPMSENHPKEPQSIYGLSKLMSEEYVPKNAT